MYNNSDDWRQIIPAEITTLPLHFKNHGYYVAGAGKIYHGGAGGFNRLSDWSDYLTKGAEPDPEGHGRARAKARRFQDDVGGVGGIRFGALDCDDQEMPDYQTVSYCLNQLKKQHDQPFFLACGLVKPHMAWSVPKKYYEMYPLETIQLPKVLETDLDDVPPAGVKMARPDGDHADILKSGRWKDAVQAYLATITFCDAMVGRLIEGFDQSAYKDNTIICLWSDHGWHLGEKQHWRKFALWEEATRAPYIWVVPGVTKAGGVCHRTVDYMQIYPTLCDLAGLPTPQARPGREHPPTARKPRRRLGPARRDHLAVQQPRRADRGLALHPLRRRRRGAVPQRRGPAWNGPTWPTNPNTRAARPNWRNGCRRRTPRTSAKAARRNARGRRRARRRKPSERRQPKRLRTLSAVSSGSSS